MIFAPVLRHTAFVNPRVADQALQRFLHSAVQAPTQVRQDEQSITLELDVPGLSREQLTITIEDNQVRVASIEGAPRQVQRAWEFAQEIDASGSSARLEKVS